MERINSIKFQGQSMGSFFQQGQEVPLIWFEKPRPIDKKDVGHVVLFKDGAEWVLHRVVKKSGEISTKGDHSLHFDHLNSIWGLVPDSKDHFLSFMSSLHHSKTPGFFRVILRILMNNYLKLKRWLL